MRRNFYNIIKKSKIGTAASTGDFYADLFSGALAAGDWPTRTITGVPPIRFISDGSPLESWTIAGNSRQDGTPAPDAPIYPEFVGTLSAGIWTVPISCGGQTVTADLSQVQTVRWINKYVFDGTQSVYSCVLTTDSQNYCCAFRFSDIGMTDIKDYDIAMASIDYPIFLSNRFVNKDISKRAYYQDISAGEMGANNLGGGGNRYIIFCVSGLTTAEEYTNWFTNNPTTLYYILATPETVTANEPLAKIGTYADGLHSADAGIMIPTVHGINTISVDTDLPPSEMTITGHIKSA